MHVIFPTLLQNVAGLEINFFSSVGGRPPVPSPGYPFIVVHNFSSLVAVVLTSKP